MTDTPTTSSKEFNVSSVTEAADVLKFEKRREAYTVLARLFRDLNDQLPTASESKIKIDHPRRYQSLSFTVENSSGQHMHSIYLEHKGSETDVIMRFRENEMKPMAPQGKNDMLQTYDPFELFTNIKALFKKHYSDDFLTQNSLSKTPNRALDDIFSYIEHNNFNTVPAKKIFGITISPKIMVIT
ncbi:MAG: hypothetical protein COB76_05095 [Alphaproteobacteria bacterium]|nr:MAG: hypothetical protein COB76_05095 [Alphaproteobacteria bacterium]